MFEPFDHQTIVAIKAGLAKMGIAASFWSIDDVHLITERYFDCGVDDEAAFEIVQRAASSLGSKRGAGWFAIFDEIESYMGDNSE